jgi:hypothetical protein
MVRIFRIVFPAIVVLALLAGCATNQQTTRQKTATPSAAASKKYVGKVFDQKSWRICEAYKSYEPSKYPAPYEAWAVYMDEIQLVNCEGLQVGRTSYRYKIVPANLSFKVFGNNMSILFLSNHIFQVETNVQRKFAFTTAPGKGGTGRYTHLENQVRIRIAETQDTEATIFLALHKEGKQDLDICLVVDSLSEKDKQVFQDIIVRQKKNFESHTLLQDPSFLDHIKSRNGVILLIAQAMYKPEWAGYILRFE